MVLSARFHGHIKPGRWDTLHYDCQGRGCNECERGWKRNDEEPEVNVKYAVLFSTYTWFKNYHQMPEAGPLLAQSAYWVNMVDWCDRVDGMYRAKIDEQNQANIEFVKKAQRYKHG